jgi:hypothetical protein
MAGAGVPEDEERRRPVRPALGDVRALGAPADGVEVVPVEERRNRKIAGLGRKLDLEPGRFLARRRLLGEKRSVFEVFFALHPSAHALARLRFLHPLFLAGLEIDGMLLDFLDDRFLLYFSFKSSEGAFDGFAFFDDNKCH